MNRREVIAAMIGAVSLPVAAKAAVVGNGNSQKPLIILHTQMRLTAEQSGQLTENARLQADQCGCEVLFCHGVDGIEVANRKYGFKETLGEYSVSGFFDTSEEMALWFPMN